LGALEENEHNQDHNVTKPGPHLMMIIRRRIVMEGGVEPTLECSGNVDHDEDFLHMTITIACTTQGKTNINFFSILEDELVTNTTQTNIHGSDNDQQILDINA